MARFRTFMRHLRAAAARDQDAWLARRASRVLVAAALSLSIIAPLFAQDSQDRAGYFDVRSASTTLVDGVHQLEARLQLVLSDDALNALNSGVALRIEMDLEVIRVRRFIPDAVEAELVWQYELEYRPLSQRYIVRNVNSGIQDSYATLYSALNNLGRVQGLPVIDDSVLSKDSQYRVRLRAALSTREYPAPLRIILFWRDEWQLKSDWYEWSLER
jgi:Domain of unknown function (DUF4390)